MYDWLVFKQGDLASYDWFLPFWVFQFNIWDGRAVSTQRQLIILRQVAQPVYGSRGLSYLNMSCDLTPGKKTGTYRTFETSGTCRDKKAEAEQRV